MYEDRSNIAMVEKNYKALLEDLESNGLGDDFRTDVIYSAGYNAPWSLKQHSEIWLISKKQSPAPLLENKNVQSTFGKYFGKLLGKMPSKDIDFTSMAKYVMSNLPFRKPGAETKSPPSFCSRYDCPEFYEVKLNATDYTLRCYPHRYRWVSTTVTGKPLIEVLPGFGL